MQRMKNNFKIGTIISFLKTIKSKPSICLLDIYYKTGLHPSTLGILRDALLGEGHIEKHQADKRRTDLILTAKGRNLLGELKNLTKR